MMSEKKNRFGKKVAITVICGLLCGGLSAAGMAGYSYLKHNKQKEAESVKKQEGTFLPNDEKGTQYGQTAEESAENRVSSVYDVSVVWDNAVPSIVEIQTKSVTAYQFFGRRYEQESEGKGTGIIIAQADELYIVTNHHVVDGATAVSVTFVDGSTASAEVKASNSEEDIAVLTVRFSDLSDDTVNNIKVASVGNSDTLTGGEMVIAIGNAAGSGQSLTVGYVSAIDREVEIEGVSMKLIQTDAAINPGNSGGALLNARGELVGINNAKLVASDVEGIGYAIPISEVVALINQMVNREEINYKDSAMLGIIGQDVTRNLSEVLGIPVGVYITEISEGSAAEKAGLPLYGVITEVNGMEVKNEEQLKEVLGYIRGGTTGTVTVQERINGEYVPKEYTVTFDIRGKKNS
ncbi:MAG: trypsin-like peptidase domain-containing protein [Lachnospiraceae bacterium]|nr:trypsin-like peptidase domain-containing protein [Lachnospiraceae bacterium]